MTDTCKYCSEEDCKLERIADRLKEYFRLPKEATREIGFKVKDEPIIKINRSNHIKLIAKDILVREYKPEWQCIKRYFGTGVSIIRPSDARTIKDLIEWLYTVVDDHAMGSEKAEEFLEEVFFEHDMVVERD